MRLVIRLSAESLSEPGGENVPVQGQGTSLTRDP